MQTAKLHASRKCNCIKIIRNHLWILCSSSTALVWQSIAASLGRRNVDYPPTLNCTKYASSYDNYYVAQTKFHAHADSKKLEGILITFLVIPDYFQLLRVHFLAGIYPAGVCAL